MSELFHERGKPVYVKYVSVNLDDKSKNKCRRLASFETKNYCRVLKNHDGTFDVMTGSNPVIVTDALSHDRFLLGDVEGYFTVDQETLVIMLSPSESLVMKIDEAIADDAPIVRDKNWGSW